MRLLPPFRPNLLPCHAVASSAWLDRRTLDARFLSPPPVQHTRQPSVTEAADEKTVERRKRRKADYELVIKRQQQQQKQQQQQEEDEEDSTSFEFASATSLTREKSVSADGEVREFARMVQRVRAGFRHDDPEGAGSNRGYVSASR